MFESFFGKKHTPRKTTLQVPRSQVYAVEEEILKRSGLELHTELAIYDVPISFEGETYNIHTYRCGDQNTETLVLLHGYGGSSVLFYPMLKELSQKYRVYCIDFLGMGLSSRPEFKCQTTEETIDYFVESLEKWREAVGLDYFTLGGHSFGGYMGTHYALKYQRNVKQLFLLSPAGITKAEKEVPIKEISQTLPWLKRKVFDRIMVCWGQMMSPAAFYRTYPIISYIMLKTYMTFQFNQDGSDKKLPTLLFEFFSEVMKTKGGSENALFYILKPPGAIAINPLEEAIMEDLHIPVVCYFGDEDWMDSAGAQRIAASGNKDFKLKQISKSGHQITMHNPGELTKDMLVEALCFKNSERRVHTAQQQQRNDARKISYENYIC